ncbi:MULTISPECIES: response regulator [unclassified Nocardioides]|uniref:response regulator n=1 Tax=unclassified Nocardioides TaxID=2615069 RepID=UPI0006F8A00D|nr:MULTISPECIES: response regulator transcription factor [unclassified Nocardioides]KRA27987.1 LuxR family transcriptional regulator [Nocardioides sp. Root614]KRA85961.1 LuxR family transcriptional regulator [Nocardioides sp. Root682]
MEAEEESDAVPTASGPIRIVMADDHEMVLHGVQAMLAHFGDEIEVVGTATDMAGAVTIVRDTVPDIILCDIRLGRDSGLDLCRQVKQLQPGIHVVFLTVYDDEQYAYQALRAEASGYVLKRVDGAELVEHLQRVMAGDVVIDPTLAGRIAMSAARVNSGEFWPGARLGLTQRESEVLALLVASHSNKGIAAKLVVSEDTVKTHIRGLYRKLAVSDRGGAIAVALREGLYQ